MTVPLLWPRCVGALILTILMLGRSRNPDISALPSPILGYATMVVFFSLLIIAAWLLCLR